MDFLPFAGVAVCVIAVVTAVSLLSRSLRTTPFFVIDLGLGFIEFEITDRGHWRTLALVNSKGMEPVISLHKGTHAIIFNLPDGTSFCMALNYRGSHRTKFDLAAGPLSDQAGLHLLLTADGETVLFERNVLFSDATEAHPCIVNV